MVVTLFGEGPAPVYDNPRQCRACNADISHMPSSHYLCYECYFKPARRRKWQRIVQEEARLQHFRIMLRREAGETYESISRAFKVSRRSALTTCYKRWAEKFNRLLEKTYILRVVPDSQAVPDYEADEIWTAERQYKTRECWLPQRKKFECELSEYIAERDPLFAIEEHIRHIKMARKVDRALFEFRLKRTGPRQIKPMPAEITPAQPPKN